MLEAPREQPADPPFPPRRSQAPARPSRVIWHALKFERPQEHKRIRGEYESRLRELEAERQMFEEDLAQARLGWGLTAV
jgi:hypothetical protein